MLEDSNISSADETHEGTGTGLDLAAEEVWIQVLAILTAAEPYFELHTGGGTGSDLDPTEAILQAEAILFESRKGEQP